MSTQNQALGLHNPAHQVRVFEGGPMLFAVALSLVLGTWITLAQQGLEEAVARRNQGRAEATLMAGAAPR